MRSMPGNPYDGHTLDEAIEEVEILANQRQRTVMVDKDYNGADIDIDIDVDVVRSSD